MRQFTAAIPKKNKELEKNIWNKYWWYAGSWNGKKLTKKNKKRFEGTD